MPSPHPRRCAPPSAGASGRREREMSRARLGGCRGSLLWPRAPAPSAPRHLLAPNPPRRVLKGAVCSAGLCPRVREGHTGGWCGDSDTAGRRHTPYPLPRPWGTCCGPAGVGLVALVLACWVTHSHDRSQRMCFSEKNPGSPVGAAWGNDAAIPTPLVPNRENKGALA